MVQVTVIGNDVAQSLKVLKKKMQREGIFREMKLRRHHEKNSEKKARRQAEAVRRARKQLRKRLDTEGFYFSRWVDDFSDFVIIATEIPYIIFFDAGTV